MNYYPNKTFAQYNISQYQKFMLTKDMREAFVFAKPDVAYSETVAEGIDAPPTVYEPTASVDATWEFQPKQSDTLFWCLYAINYGTNDYNNIGFNYGVKELEEKQKLAAFIKANGARIKGTNYKVTNVLIQEILSELLTSQKETSMAVLIALTVFYNINVLLVDANDRCMLEFWSNKQQYPPGTQENYNSFSSRNPIIEKGKEFECPEGAGGGKGEPGVPPTNKEDALDGKTYILRKDKYGKYRAQLEWISSSRVAEMRDRYMVLDSYLRPMKAASNYKVDELIELARKLAVYDENKKYKKSDLYDVVHELCKWT